MTCVTLGTHRMDDDDRQTQNRYLRYSSGLVARALCVWRPITLGMEG